MAEKGRGETMLNHVNNNKKTYDEPLVDVAEIAMRILAIRRKEKLEFPLKRDDMSELGSIISQYGPTFSFAALYMRLGRKFRRHYNTDSVAVVRTLAEQTNMDPINFMLNLFCYRCAKPSRVGGLPPYGFRMYFGFYKKEREDTPKFVDCKLAEVVQGLKITSRRLEYEIVKSSSRTFINLGRCKESDRDYIDFHLKNQNNQDMFQSEILRVFCQTKNSPKKTAADTKRKGPGRKKESPIPIKATPKQTTKVITNQKCTRKRGATLSSQASTNRRSKRIATKCFHKPPPHTNSTTESDEESFFSDHSWSVTSNTTEEDNFVEEEILDDVIDCSDPKYEDADLTLYLGDEKEFNFGTKPLLRTHLLSTFDRRLLSQVEHRCLCLAVVMEVFGTTLAYYREYHPGELEPTKVRQSVAEIKAEQNHEFMKLSFRMTSECYERKYFVEYLNKICLIFPSRETIIRNRVQLKEFWDRRSNDDIGSEIKTWVEEQATISEDSMIHQMDQTFDHFRNLYKGKNFTLASSGTTKDVRINNWWKCIKCNVHRHFLDFGSNTDLKKKLRKIHKNSKRKPPPANPPPKKKKKANNKKPQTKLPKTRRKEDDPKGNKHGDETSNDTDSDCSAITCDHGNSILNLLNKRGADSIQPSHFHRHPEPRLPTTRRRTNDLPFCIPKSSLQYLRNNPEVVDRLQIASNFDLQTARVDSRLIIERENHKYHVALSNYEIYLALSLCKHRHGRLTKHLQRGHDHPQLSGIDTQTFIPSTRCEEHIKDVVHVVRPDSATFRNLPSVAQMNLDIPLIIKALLSANTTDSKRAKDAVEINFGAAGPTSGKDEQTGIPNAVGMGKNATLIQANKGSETRKMIGSWARVVWDCNQAMLEKTLQPGLAIRSPFPERVKEFLHIPKHVPFGYEHGTLRLEPMFSTHEMHKDIPNCSLPGSSATGASNICLIDPVTNNLYLLQLILNYRKAITSYLVPYYKDVIAICNHIELLVRLIQKSIGEILSNRQSLFPPASPLNMDNFFLDDSFPYKEHFLDSANTIKLPILTLPIGFSRIFSLSASVHVLQESRRSLSRRQVVELCFIVSLLNTTVRFYYTMNHLLELSKNGLFGFSEHPFEDWYAWSIKFFNSWQGGPFPRYSSAGLTNKQLKDIFLGTDGTTRLDGVVDALCDFLSWVDGQSGNDSPEDIPLESLQSKYQETVTAVNSAAGKDFGNFGAFRLGVFLSTAIGASLTKQGKHVRQIFYPTRGSAARNHLTNPRGNVMTDKQASDLLVSNTTPRSQETDVPADDLEVVTKIRNFDEVLRLACHQLGFSPHEAFRDFFECALCESKEGRKLEKKDVLIKGVPIYILDHRGVLKKKLPGISQVWRTVQPHPFKIAAST